PSLPIAEHHVQREQRGDHEGALYQETGDGGVLDRDRSEEHHGHVDERGDQADGRPEEKPVEPGGAFLVRSSFGRGRGRGRGRTRVASLPPFRLPVSHSGPPSVAYVTGADYHAPLRVSCTEPPGWEKDLQNKT